MLNHLKKILSECYRLFVEILIRLLGFFPLKNKVMCISYYGKGVGCNPKYIVTEVSKRQDNIKIYWAVSKMIWANDEKINFTKYGSILFYYHLATSKVWISNVRIPYYWYKKDTQYYIQTWHGSIPLKKIENDAIHSLSEGYLKDAKYDSKVANLFVSNSDFNTRLYRESFWYNGEIVECGCPRNDILLRNDKCFLKRIKHNILNNECNKKVVLYAPTFRNTYDLSVYNVDFERCIYALEQKYNCEFVLLLRLHPNVSHLSKTFTKNIHCVDVTFYEDMQELLLISDVLITDYSSSMFDFAIMEKPVFLYASDIEEYEVERNFYFELKKLPFPVAENNDELENNIFKFSVDKYNSDLRKFYNKLNVYESGHAGEVLADKIINILNNI